MGAWSASISGNDFAMDLRSEYTAAFHYYDVPTAVEKIEAYVRAEGCSEQDPAEWCDYVYSLADFMWKKGILTEDIKQRALRMIDSSFGLDLWAESGKSILSARKKALEKFRAQLLSPMPEKKKIKLNVYLTDIFETDDLIAMPLKTAGKSYKRNEVTPMTDEEFQSYDGKYILIQKIGSYISWTSQIVPEVRDHWATFRLLEGIYDEIPVIEDISHLKDACLMKRNAHNKLNPTPLFYCESSMHYFKRRKYQRIGNFPVNADAYANLPQEGIYWGAENGPIDPDSILLSALTAASSDKPGFLKRLLSHL